MKITRYKDILPFTKSAAYAVDYFPKNLLDWIKEEQEHMGLQLCPDFQRGHVWTKGQQSAYIEYVLRGGKSGRDIYFNCPFWDDGKRSEQGGYQDYVCVDGLQRITAWKRFFENELRVFGSLSSEFEDSIPHSVTMRVHVNDLQTREDVLQWYLDMNAGGTPHTSAELNRVRNLLENERKKMR